MPEGPEIRLAADEVAKALVGHKVTRLNFAFARLKKFEKNLAGRRVTAVKTRGKAILTCFDNDWIIYSHNQLYGRWFISAPGKLPDTRRQLRLAIHNHTASALLYSASDIDVLRSSEMSKHPFLARIGPDILSDDPTVDSIVERLMLPQFSNRQLAGLLLDQGFLAGLGNYLRAEILTVAGLHPLCRPGDCSRRQLRKLAATILRLTRRSYRTRGIVNPPALVSRLRARGLTRREDYRFNTYGRAGKACYLCGQSIEVSNAGGRKMYYCPGCQGKPPRRKPGKS